MLARSNRTLAMEAFVGVSGILWAAPCVIAQPMEARQTCSIPFTGSASGGRLVLSDNVNRNCRFVVVDTEPAESAESVAVELAQAIKDQNPFKWLFSGAGSPDPELSRAYIAVSASTGRLNGLMGACSEYMTGGTEVGLGISAAPISLTCNYDPALKRLRLQWANPSSAAYESIRVVSNYHNYDWRGEDLLAGARESYEFDMGTPLRSEHGAMNDFDVWVIGVSHDIPSNAAAIHIRGQVQEELFGIPFARGVAPNWTSWSADKRTAVACEMGERAGLANRPGVRRYNAVTTPDEKPFYQVLTSTGEAGAQGGIRRDFLGLSPGHTYRVTVRLSTLELGLPDGSWSYSLHAVPYRAETTRITGEQMAGRSPLPDGSRGESAGLVAKFDGQRTTAGKYEECAREIALTEGTDSIAVWLRFNGDRAGNKVAMDYARLEDLGQR